MHELTIADQQRLLAAAPGSGVNPSISQEEAVAITRWHADLERIRSGDYDAEIWDLWQQEGAAAGPGETNRDVLDRVLDRLREGD